MGMGNRGYLGMGWRVLLGLRKGLSESYTYQNKCISCILHEFKSAINNFRLYQSWIGLECMPVVKHRRGLSNLWKNREWFV